MKRLPLICICAGVLIVTGCKKKSVEDVLSPALEQRILTDFADVLANPNYIDIEAKAGALNTAVVELNATTTDDNLTAARDSWRTLLAPWEKAEAYLFGPVEDFNYDPTMDTWPVDKVQMDSLLGSTNPLGLSDIDALPSALKGFHPIEYMLFGVGETKVAADFTVREKLYLASLTQSLFNTTADLRKSWDVNEGNYSTQLTTAGSGSARFSTRKDAFIVIAQAMAGICEEVGEGKMEDPLTGGPGGLPDSTLEESQFSHNSTTDFRNNIIGIQNVYLCRYLADGHGFNELVAARNLSLDSKLQSQITVAINSFDAISSNYGEAVYAHQ